MVGEADELKGKRARIGLRHCKACKKDFTVKVGTAFESSHIELHKWFQAEYLMGASKKGISAHQLHRTLEITYKGAWFMAHRLREAMRALMPKTWAVRTRRLRPTKLTSAVNPAIARAGCRPK